MKNKLFRLFPSAIATSSILLAPALHRSCHANDGDGPPPPQGWLKRVCHSNSNSIPCPYSSVF
jgi:hypothetical protein